MSSFHYMNEILKDNEQRIERANRYKPYDTRREGAVTEKHPSPGIFLRFANSIGNLLVQVGIRLQALPT